MTTLFLLVTGVCQSLNELGMVSVTKKWSGQNRTSPTACYGPARLYSLQPVNNAAALLEDCVEVLSQDCQAG